MAVTNYTRTDAPGDCLMPARSDAHGWLAFLGEGAKLLAERGITVTLASDFPYRIEVADDWFIELDDGDPTQGDAENAGSDWFNLTWAYGSMASGSVLCRRCFACSANAPNYWPLSEH